LTSPQGGCDPVYGKGFTPQELSCEDSKGLEGVLFRYYTCAACGQADIFRGRPPPPAGAGGRHPATARRGSRGRRQRVVQGNLIGTYTSGNAYKGNAFRGVWVLNGAAFNTIGGFAPGAGNVIADNGAAGVVIGVGPQDKTAVSNAILSNSIYANHGLGIDLGNLGLDPSLTGPGPNNFQSAPLIANAQYNGATTVVRLVVHDATPGATFTIQIFASPSPNGSGYGDGRTLIATVTGVVGNVVVIVPVPGNQNLAGQYITATATDSAGNTSEFSNAVVAN
jgi:hypothetical protein